MDRLLNQVLCGIVVYFVVSSARSILPSRPTESEYSQRPATHLPVQKWMKLTRKQLAEYDGEKQQRILFAIRGLIFDLSAGTSFYGPGGAYAIFAGQDASRGLAKQSFEPDMLTPLDKPRDDLSDLSSSEWSNLKEWESHFKGKYWICGELVD